MSTDATPRPAPAPAAAGPRAATTRIRHEVEIAAPVERVWDLTVDVERWPSLTPTITEVTRLDDGPLRPGSSARIKQPAQRARTWTVTRLEPARAFAWEAPLAWLTLTGIHELEPVPGGCRNTLAVEVTGFGGGIVRALVGRQFRKAIATENAGFKAAAEQAG